MQKAIINDAKLLKMIREGVTQAAAAKHFGVTPQAVSKRLKELQGRRVQVIVAKEHKEVLENFFDARGELNKIYQRTQALLEKAEAAEDHRDTLSSIAEIRQQIRLAADIDLRMDALEEAINFMTIVKEALKEASPDAYRKFQELIKRERSVRPILKFA